MNRGFVASGLVAITFGLALFWHLFYSGELTITTQPIILIWGVTGSIGLILTLIGLATGRKPVQKMPSRICVHCGRAIGFTDEQCPYCGEAVKPIIAQKRGVERKEGVPLARKLGRLFAKI